MKVVEGAIVTIEGSDTLWIVNEVMKDKISVTDQRMGIVTLEDLDIGEVIEVVGYDIE